MSRNLPARRVGERGRPSRADTRVAQAREKTEVAIYEHSLEARFQAECDQADGDAVSDAFRCALDNELNLLDYGLAKAGNSQAKRELVSRYVTLLSDTNLRRVSRRFGG